MANTKIINLKRYSKKRVPKKVLKGGAFAKAARAPRSPARRQRRNRSLPGSPSDSDDESTARGRTPSRDHKHVREGPERGRPPERTPGRRSERPRDPSSDTVLETKKYARASPRSPRSLSPRSPRSPRSLSPRERRSLSENEKLRILKKKLREGDGFVRLSTAAPKLEGPDRDDYILETWGHLIHDNGQRIENFDDIFEEVAKRELTRPPSPPHSPHSPRRRLTGMPRSKSMEMAIKKRQAEANEKKLLFLRRMLGKLKNHDPGAYNKYEINKARIKNLEDLNKYILDIWGLSDIFDHNGNLRRDKYNGDDAVLEELVKAVNTKFRDTANHRTGTPRPPPRGPPPRRPPPRGPPPRGPPPRRPPAAAAIAEQNRVTNSKLEAAASREAEARAEAKAARRALEAAQRPPNPKTLQEMVMYIFSTEREARNNMENTMPNDTANINKLVEQDRDKIRKIFLLQGYCPKQNDITAVEESLIMIRYNKDAEGSDLPMKKDIIKKLEKYNVSNLPSTLAEMLVKERILFNKISNYGLDVTNILNLDTEGWGELGLTEEDQAFITQIAKVRRREEDIALAAKIDPSASIVAGLELWWVGNNSNYNEIYMDYLENWESASWELNKKKYEMNTHQKTEKDLKDSIKDSIKDWINIDTNERDMFSISIKLNDDLKVPYPYFLDKMNKLNYDEYKNDNDEYKNIVDNTDKILKFIDLNSFFLIQDDLKDRLQKYYDVEYRAADNAHDGGAIRGGASTTAEDFIMLMAKWCFIIWGYKTLNKNFCNKYLENKKPSSSYTKEQLSLDYRRKITGITRIYTRDGILMKNQFVIKASLNKAHIPDYKKEINNYEKLWENNKNYKEKYGDDNKFKVLKYFGSSEKWHKENIDNNKGYKGYSSSPSPVQAADQQWKEKNLVWEYDNQSKVLTIINKINDKIPLKISTNLDKHTEAIKNNGEKTTSNVCWFAIEWDPDFIPFSTSHSGGERDLKLDQTVLRNMKENIYHLSKTYGFYHGDLHTENFLYNIKGDIRRFDFDFSGIINENNNPVDNVPNDQINVYFGWQPSKISMFLFFNLYKNGTWGDDSKGNMKWNPTASGKQAYPKHQHLEFLRLFDTHRMLLHYFLSTKGPYNTNVNDIKGVIEKIFTEEEEEEEEKKHKKLLIESVTNNMYTFWNGSATKKEFEKRLDSDMIYENTWNAGCMYSLLWYFGKYKNEELDNEDWKKPDNEDWKKWYDYDNHLQFFEIHLKNLLKILEAQKVRTDADRFREPSP